MSRKANKGYIYLRHPRLKNEKKAFWHIPLQETPLWLKCSIKNYGGSFTGHIIKENCAGTVLFIYTYL